MKNNIFIKKTVTEIYGGIHRNSESNFFKEFKNYVSRINIFSVYLV